MTSYDAWKTTEPDAETLGDAPQSNVDRILMEYGQPETRKSACVPSIPWVAMWPDYEEGHPIGFGKTEGEALSMLIAETELAEEGT